MMDWHEYGRGSFFDLSEDLSYSSKKKEDDSVEEKTVSPDTESTS